MMKNPTQTYQASYEGVLRAHESIQNHVFRTPCKYSKRLSELTGSSCYLKMENLQLTGSFKDRGALYRLQQLSEDERKRGVIAYSAGNHAQGVASHANNLGIPATIVMPVYTPLIKVTATRRYGARVVLYGDSAEEAWRKSYDIAEEENLVYIHPFDDPWVIEGQGTVGLELLSQVPDLDAVLVPVGGGGLLAGLSLAIKNQASNVKIYGIESSRMPALYASKGMAEPAVIPSQRTLAEGIAISQIGALPYPIIKRYIDDVVTVSDEAIASAILVLLELEKTLVEGAGAVGLAALKEGLLPLKGKKVALILTGGNLDVTILSRIIERGLVEDGRMARLTIEVVDAPGALALITHLIGKEGANILKIHHERAFSKRALGLSHVSVTIETKGHKHLEQVLNALREVGLQAETNT